MICPEKSSWVLVLLVPLAFAGASDRELARNGTEGTPSPVAVETEVAAGLEVEGRNREIAGPKEDSSKSLGWKSSSPGSSRSKDSYLEALRHSRTSTDPREGVVGADGIAVGPARAGSTTFQRRKEYTPGPVYAPTSPRIVHGPADRDAFSLVPSSSYSLPTRTSGDFHDPRISYAAPQPQPQPPRASYGPPFSGYHSYGEYAGAADPYLPPQQAYGPPSPSSAYGPPAAGSGSGSYGHGTPEISLSHAIPSIGFSWPFALKLNAFTLAKILLKLVIFKMIVKFIAVICLLLFIPKLEIKKSKRPNMDDDDDDDDEGRRLMDADSRIARRLNVLTAEVDDAVIKYRELNEARSNSSGECSTFACQARSALIHRESWQDYAWLLESYASDEAPVARAKSRRPALLHPDRTSFLR